MRETAGGFVNQTATDWSNHDTPSMWRMLESQETENHWRHAVGLRKLAELTSTHMSRLRQYRDRLADAWPPSNNAASQAFISRFDYLIDHVSDTHEVAVANYTTFTTAITTIEGARAAVKGMLDEFEGKIAAHKEYVSLIESAKASQLPGTTIGPPPVTDADLEHINDRARTVMSNLSNTLALATTQLRHPAPYGSSATWEDSGVGGGGLGQLSVMPAIVSLNPPGAPQHPSLRAVRDSSKPNPRLQGPVLGAVGVQGAARQTDGSLGRVASSSTIIRATPSSGLGVIGRIDAEPRSRGTADRAEGNGRSTKFPSEGAGAVSSANTRSKISPNASSSPTPANGVIGANPQVARQSDPRRVDRGREKRSNLDSPWEIANGVDSVINPPHRPAVVDPGPAIGLGR